MCWMLYLASDVEVPLVPWDVDHPAFYIEHLDETQEVVRKHFSLPNVVYVGSHEGCGCGFHYYEELPESEQLGEMKSIERLAQSIRSIVQHGGGVELLLCWSGDEGNEPMEWIDLIPENFGPHEFPMELRQAARIRAVTH